MLPALTLWAVTAGVWDLGRRRLPNLLTLGGMAAALVWVVFTGRTPAGSGAMEGFLSGLAALALTLPAWHLGVMGAGDVKLAAAMGLLGGGTGDPAHLPLRRPGGGRTRPPPDPEGAPLAPGGQRTTAGSGPGQPPNGAIRHGPGHGLHRGSVDARGIVAGFE